MPRKKKLFLVNYFEKHGVKGSESIVGPVIRVFRRYCFKGPHVTTPFPKGHFCEFLSYSVTIAGSSNFTMAAAITFIVNYSFARTTVIES